MKPEHPLLMELDKIMNAVSKLAGSSDEIYKPYLRELHIEVASKKALIRDLDMEPVVHEPYVMEVPEDK